ncbi:hypothetical protein NKH45_35725, partial [Mesorhizobium sp. M1156]|uniref:hypothetical protein n=1 Tax=Mesorhizobium sp. M1156 TaxID=2957064 RepID=UPI00333BE81F
LEPGRPQAGAPRPAAARGATRVELVAFVGQPEAHVLDRAHEHRRIVSRGNEAPALPVALGLSVDRPHHHRATADDVGASDAAMQRVLEAAADALSGIAVVDGELSDQQPGNRIGRPAGASSRSSIPESAS